MTTTGVTSKGFVPKTVTQLVSDITQKMLDNIDPTLNTSAEEPIGQIVGIIAEEIAELWEATAVAYNGFNRAAAEGPQLDNIGQLTGTPRDKAQPSRSLQTCVFSQTGTYEAGTLVCYLINQPNVQFKNTNDVIVTGATPVTVTGVAFECLVNGPTVAPAGTLTGLVPVTGWSSTTNPTDAVLGALAEQDTPYRIRQDAELTAVGSGNLDSMKADILNVTNDQGVSLVQDCFVFENTGDTIDGNNLPPHSFNVVIWDGIIPAADNNDIAQIIWDNHPSGIFAYGSVSGNAIDSDGNTRVMLFDRAPQLTLYLDYTVTLKAGALIANVAPLVKQAAVDYALANLGLGDQVVALQLKSAVLGVEGVIDVPTLKLGFTVSPVNTANLAVPARQIAIADTSRITVNGL